MARGSPNLRRHASRIGAAFAATLLSIVLAGTVLGASWSALDQLSSSGRVFGVDVATINSSTAVAVYAESDDAQNSLGLFRRRSTDGGQSWGSPLLIASHGDLASIAAHGMNVDIVWNSPNGRVRYARSTNGGQTFGSSRPLSPRGRFAWRPAVAHGPNGVVVVVYEDVLNGNVFARVSTNNGASFAAPDLLTGKGEESGLAAAVGDGVIYAAYSVGFDRLRIRRSLDNGATWEPASVVTNEMWDFGFSLTAEGDHAYIAYTGPNDFPQFGQVKYRRTINGGATWQSQRNLASGSWSTHDPDLGLAGGVLHAAFTRCTPEFDICEKDRIFYRRSTTGTSWGTPHRVSPRSFFFAFSPAVGSHRAVVTFIGEHEDGLDAYARTRVP